MKEVCDGSGRHETEAEFRYPIPKGLLPFKPVILGFGELSSRPFQRKADHFVNYQAGSSAEDN